jgi:hypothetical protein
MVFLCPTCNVNTSGKGGGKPAAVKSGKGWRMKQKQRSIMPIGSVLGYNCPCCKEMRSLGQYNPFKKLKPMLPPPSAGAGRKESRKVAPSHMKTLDAPEETTKSVQYLLAASGVSLESITSADCRRFDKVAEVVVSWDDTIEMRRFALKKILIAALTPHVVKIQTMIRMKKAKARIKTIRYLHSQNIPF